MQNMKRGIVCVFSFVALAVWPLGHAAAQTGKEIVIGYTGPLSGPAAEYGQDCLNGIELAVHEINAEGGITVHGQKYLFKVVKLDDMISPAQAVNNCLRLREEYNAGVVFNPVFNTLAAMAKINQEKKDKFLIMAYTSTPKVVEMGNKLLVAIPPPFTIYVQSFADHAWKQGWRKAAMVVTLGAYGDEWRQAFKEYWEKKGGVITADKPANYYTETDFSSQLTAALATKPDVMLIGGPSATTALVIEQARGLGYKGGFILIDQAKMDYIANILKGNQLMNNTIGVAAVALSPTEEAPVFDRKYVAQYKRMQTWEVSLNYDAMYAVSRAMAAAGTVDNPAAIKAAFPKAFPLPGSKFPVEYYGITPGGRMELAASVQMIKDGKYSPVEMVVWWLKTEKEFNQFKANLHVVGNPTLEFFQFEKEQ